MQFATYYNTSLKYFMTLNDIHIKSNSRNVELSIVIPTYNSNKYIEKSLEETVDALQKLQLPFEILILDDNSKDNTVATCKALKRQFENLRVIQFYKNHGQRNATSLGYTLSQGRYVITLDDDLQFAPYEISKLYSKIHLSKFLVVSGYSSYLQESQWYRSIKKTLFLSFNYLFFPRYSRSKYVSSFKIYNKHLLDKLGIINIFYFWKLDPNQIGTIKVSKRRGLRYYSQYSFKVFLILLAPLLLKILAKIGLFITVTAVVFGGFFYCPSAILISSCSLLLSTLSMLFVCKEKTAFLNKNHREH